MSDADVVTALTINEFSSSKGRKITSILSKAVKLTYDHYPRSGLEYNIACCVLCDVLFGSIHLCEKHDQFRARTAGHGRGIFHWGRLCEYTEGSRQSSPSIKTDRGSGLNAITLMELSVPDLGDTRVYQATALITPKKTIRSYLAVFATHVIHQTFRLVRIHPQFIKGEEESRRLTCC